MAIGFDLGSLIGGFIGAAGAVSAVYLLISRQRREEAGKVSNALRHEVIVLSEILINQLRILEGIRSGEIIVTRGGIRAAIMNPDPVIYKAVASGIGLISEPVVQFYMRMVEIQSNVQIIVFGPGGENVPVPGEEAETTAKSVIIACRLAQAIISHASDQRVNEKEIERITLVHIDEALERAKKSFPNLKVISAGAVIFP